MLAESWIPVPPEDAGEEAGPPPPAFEAAAPEYNVSCPSLWQVRHASLHACNVTLETTGSTGHQGHGATRQFRRPESLHDCPTFTYPLRPSQELVRRLAKTAPFRKWNELTIQAKQLEQEVAGLKGPDAEVRSW